LLLQQRLIGKAAGMSEEALRKNELTNRKIFDVINQSNSLEQLNTDLTQMMMQMLKDDANTQKPSGMSDENFVKLQVSQMGTAWMRYFIQYNPALALEKVKCPVLALNGEKDLQVPPKENLETISKALAKAGNKKVTTMEIPNLNHLFQECKTGSPYEYASIEQTFSPTALTEILKWIQVQTK
ncbi:MAG: prolyl oligopeptidase family serine peptidase, partial [Cyclobacteriaceae bacterium]|nr:prolyl oligopeptidase family serine peptidase [Cyclobacteriaceae bacterium]